MSISNRAQAQSLIVNRAANRHSSLFPILAVQCHTMILSLVKLPFFCLTCQIGSISWMSRTGLPGAPTVDENLLCLQRGPDRPTWPARSYKEVKVIRTLQFENLSTKVRIKF